VADSVKAALAVVLSAPPAELEELKKELGIR